MKINTFPEAMSAERFLEELQMKKVCNKLTENDKLAYIEFKDALNDFNERNPLVDHDCTTQS